MIGKLILIQLKVDTKEKNDDPIKYLKDKRTDGNRPIVVAGASVSKLVFDDGDQSG